MQFLHSTCAMLAAFVTLAAVPADDPDPWLGVMVVVKTADVRAKDDQGKVVKEYISPFSTVVKVDGDRLGLRFLGEPTIGWVTKADVIRRDEAEAFFTEQIRTKPTAFAYRSRGMLRAAVNSDPASQEKGREDSLADLSEAIRLDPTDGLAFISRTSRWLAKKDYDRAFADTAEALRLLGDDATWRERILRMRAALYMQKGDEARSLAEFDELLRLAGDDADRRSEAMRNRAFTLSIVGKNERALADFDESLKIAGVSLKAKIITFGDRARLHQRMGKLDLARADFDEAVQICPADSRLRAGALYQRAVMLAKSEPDRVLADLDEAIRLDPTDRSAHTLRGDLLKAKGDLPGAIASYSRALAELPSVSEYDRRAQAYAAMKDYDRAIADYDRILHLNPNWPRLHLARGQVRLDKGDNDGAIADFDEAIKRQPNSAQAYLQRGRASHHKGDYDRAIADYSESIRFNPNDSTPFHNRALARRAGGDPGGSIADFTEAIRLNPKFAKSHAWRGFAYHELNRSQDAIADYERALELDPKEEGWVRLNIGDLKLAANDYDGAIAAYTDHLAAVTPTANLYAQRARAWRGKRDLAKAVDDFDNALRIEPKNVTNLLDRADLLYYLGRFDDSLAGLNTAVQLDPMNARAHLGLSRAFWKLEQHDKAAAECEDAVRLDPTLADAWCHRGLLRYGKGQWADALSDFDEAIRVGPKIAMGHAGRSKVLATSADEKIRDGKKAVEAATRACELSGGAVSYYVFCLADAQAEAGDFDAALKTLDKLEAMLPADHPQRDTIEYLRSLFRAHKPFHLPAGGVTRPPTVILPTGGTTRPPAIPSGVIK